MIGPLREVNPVIVANPSRDYDWRFLVDLPVLVVANTNTPQTAVRGVVTAIKALPARSLGLWFADRQNGQHSIVERVPVRPDGLLRHFDTQDRRNYAGIGIKDRDFSLCK